MATIQLSRPAAGSRQSIQSAPDGSYVFNFPADAATLSKNGDNLVLTFEDGAVIEVQDFYKSHNAEHMPSFTVDGAEVTGQDFFAALDDELSPAAGPSARASAQSSHYNEWGNASLMDGTTHLGPDDLDGVSFESGTVNYASVDVVGRRSEEDSGSASLSTVAATGPAAEPAAGPNPTPAPEDRLIAQDDAYSGGIMNSVTLSNLVGNDTLGSNQGDNVRDHTIVNNQTHGGAAEMLGNDLVLTLNGDALQDSLYESGTRGGIIQGEVNTAARVKPVGGQLEVEYTAQDATGAYTDTATATITVGDNKDAMSGGDGKDVAWVAGNTGTINTGNGADLVVAESNSGVIDAGAGSDSIYVGSSDAGSLLDGGVGNDKINVSGTNKGEIDGGAGSDTITVYENAGKIYGGSGEDTIDVVEGSGANAIYGGADRDLLVLRGGSSYMDGGEGNDLLKAQGDDDEHRWDRDLDAAERNDAQYATLVGGAGNDNLKASDASHHNVLYGDDPNDPSVVGNDLIEVFNYSHHNTVHGGGGSDEVKIMRWSHHNEAYGDDGADKLYVQDQAQFNTLHGGANDDILTARRQNYNDLETGKPFEGTVRDNKLYGDEGNDKLYAKEDVEHNSLYGGVGNDELYAQGNSTSNKLYGEDGNDHLWAQTNAHDNELYGGEGKDVLKAQGSAANNKLYGDEGNDTLFAQNNASGNTLEGGEGSDYLYAEGNATGNELYGGAGNDLLYARSSATDNILDGGEGDDYLFSGDYASANTLLGDIGNDLIVYNASDKLIDGGEGIDILLSAGNENLDDLLNSNQVENVEVLIKGADALSLTGIRQLADEYGIKLSEMDANGNASKMTLDLDQWTDTGNGSFTFNGGDLTLEVNGTTMQEEGGDAQQAVFILSAGA